VLSAVVLFSLLSAQSAPAPSGEELAAKAARGKEALGAGRFAEAAALYREIVRALPDEPGMLMNLGMAEAMSGRQREAIPHLRAAVKLSPDLLPALYFLGACHVEIGQPRQAVQPLSKVVAADAKNDEARAMLAEALLATERYESAASHFAKLVERVPDSARAWYGLGRSYEGLSLSVFEQLQRGAPDSAFVSLLGAEALALEGQHAKAFGLYRDALEKTPNLKEAHEAIAAIYEETGHADWAAAEREKAKVLPDIGCESVQSLACDFRTGRYAAALQKAGTLRTPESQYFRVRAANELARGAFEKLEALGPSAEASLFRVQLLSTQGRHLEAAEALRAGMRSWPRDARLPQQLARSLFLARDYESARPLLESLLSREPGSSELAYLLGATYLQLQQPEKALAALEKSVASDPRGLPARAALGRAYVEAGKLARALPHLEAATSIDEDGSLHYQLARAYQATKQPGKAKAALAAYQQIREQKDARARSAQQEFRITAPR
jgi:tetratricopeptide (TPR) repeat protein